MRSIPTLALAAAAATGLMALSLAPAGNAALGDEPPPITPRAIPKIRGPEVKKAVERILSEIHWQTDLDHALAIAKEERKPVFWLQLVGNLDDGL